MTTTHCLAILLTVAVGCNHDTARKPTTARPLSTAPRSQPNHVESATIVAKIHNEYMAHVKRCYTNHLKNDAEARGTLVLEFTTDANGRVTEHSATGVADDIDQCIAAKMVEWQFPPSTDETGTPVEASFKLSLNLVPE
jgi:hypothetical protein